MDTSVAWLAGLLEGEGCFTLIHNGYRQTGLAYPRIQLNMTDRDVVRRAADLLGVKKISVTQPVPGLGNFRKEQYRIGLVGSRALDWMLKIFPHMGVRRRRDIEAILSSWEHGLKWIPRRKP